MNAEILVFIEHKFFVNSFTISLFWGNILEKRYPMKYKRILLKISGVEVKEQWITGDARPGREKEQWLNLILQKI